MNTSNAKFLLFLFSFLTTIVSAQQKTTIKVIDTETKETLPATVIRNNDAVLGITDSAGIYVLQNDKKSYHLSFDCLGYEKLLFSFTPNGKKQIQIALTPSNNMLSEVNIVASTRNNQRIENSPLKVEVLGKEEMAEENTIKPGNIVSLLGDMSGVQLQQTSAVSGNTTVRIQGLDGRYTQILRDGMPLYDGFSGDFGILSIPPLDLKQIEMIKGSASTLYGGGAIGGLINILSKTPTTRQEAVLTLNATTLTETNVNTYLSKRYKKFGYTFFGGTTNQSAVDVDKDGFSDVGNLHNVVIHPRLFFYPDALTTLTAGYTVTVENRLGGDMQVIADNEDATHQYFEKNNTIRHTGELSFTKHFDRNIRLDFKNSFSSFKRKITTDTHYFNGLQNDYFSELSLLVPYGRSSLVGGLNFTGNSFRKLPCDSISLHNFSHQIAGAFVQNTWNMNDKLLIEAGLRNDYHFQYGNFILPRLATFYRFDKHWAARAGAGMGYKAPSPFASQLVDYDIEQLQPIGNDVVAEKSVGYNLEANYKTTWGDENSFFVNHAFFLTKVDNPIIATEQTNGEVTFANMDKPVISEGFDTYIKADIEGWELYAGYTFTIVKRTYLSDNQFMPLTPKNRFAFTLVRDFDEIGMRFGLEGSYTGSQYRLDATQTPGYYFMAAMIEKRIGKYVSVVLNGENLLDYRQSNVESLYTGSISNPTFVPLWAPIDGRVINLSLKISL
ncbi:MAG: TonB-dependent receptor [Paludibacter sp.]|nr:TonB-dependent receptor [Paludibacter sp.]